jgi:glyoxylase-like metal-dependent hydrolase (beta-lactamase superfamily II)
MAPIDTDELTTLTAGHPPMIRESIICSVLALAATVATPTLAQQAAAPTVLATHALNGGAYWVEGGRSNTGFIVGDQGVIVIDTQMTPDDAHKALAEVTKVTSKPVNQVIVTHGDPDHVGGLLAYPAGTPIIAHENTRAKIQAAAEDPSGGPVYGALYKALAALPIHTINSTETVVIDGVRMVLMYFGPAHTSGDLVIYLPKQKIVYGGDILLTNIGRYPVIHIGGSSQGWINAMKALLALNARTYVTGHGPMETRAQMLARVRDVEQRREQVKAMVADHKSLAEVSAALPEPGANAMFLTFTNTVYNELSKGYPPATPPWFDLVKK